MVGVARRAVAVAGCAMALVGVAAVPSFADPSVVDTTLDPTFGPVGTTVHITATSGLAAVDEVAFGSSAAEPPVSVTDTEVVAVVPDDATTGPILLSYSDSTPPAQTDETYTVQVATAATIARSRAVVTVPDRAVISSVLTAAGVAVSGQPAHLQRAAPGSSDWATIRAQKATSSRGRVHWHVTPRDTAAFRVVFPSTPAYLGTHSARTHVDVRPLVVLHAPQIAPVYTATRLHGHIRPAGTGDLRLLLEQRVAGEWQQVAHSRTDSDGRFSFTRTFDAVDTYAFRVRRPHDLLHRSGTSDVAHVDTVQRTLRSGMSGPDVRTLQKRLKALHYDVGHVDGQFAYDTVHAVVAFQKVQGITRDAVVDLPVWRRLDDPKLPKLRHADDASTDGVEVDLTRQVVYYAVRGHVRAVLDASSGGGYAYTGSDGTTQQAITPTGHYHVIYKYDGWQSAPLGELYRPAYFRNDGYAIHGSNSVPNYPASHGCIRVTVPAMDRFYDRFHVGMSVWVYRS